jgi:hypothetical protein
LNAAAPAAAVAASDECSALNGNFPFEYLLCVCVLHAALLLAAALHAVFACLQKATQ